MDDCGQFEVHEHRMRGQLDFSNVALKAAEQA